MSIEKKYGAIGILTFTMIKAGNVPLSNLVKVLSAFTHEIYIVTGVDISHPSPNVGDVEPVADCMVHTYKYNHGQGKNIFTRVIKYVYTQLKISYKMIKLRKKLNPWVFTVGGEGLLLPMLTAKCLRKDVVMALPGSGVKVARSKKDPLWRGLWFLNRTNVALSSRIVVYGSASVHEYGLDKYRNKTTVAYETLLDLDLFKTRKTLDERKNLVGYIGRLGKEKGVWNFLQAIPELLGNKPNIDFIVGGVGELQNQVEEYFKNPDLKDRAEYLGWIPHENLPDYLNDLRLLVIPSYTEGQPNIMLEAMACGTPVLAMPVGSVPDVITDGETGFLMEDNSPECIARDIIRAMSCPNLEDMVRNAHAIVEKRCTYEAVVQRYRGVLDGLNPR